MTVCRGKSVCRLCDGEYRSLHTDIPQHSLFIKKKQKKKNRLRWIAVYLSDFPTFVVGASEGVLGLEEPHGDLLPVNVDFVKLGRLPR